MPPPTPTPTQIARAKRYEANFRRFGRGLATFADGVVLRDGDVEVFAAPFQVVYITFFPPCWSPADAPARLATALKLAKQTGQGLSIIAGPSASPALHDLLHGHGLRCGYWVPFMLRDLSQRIPRPKRIGGVKLRVAADLSIFDEFPHPYHGRMSTKLRRTLRGYQQSLIDKGRAVQVIAFAGDRPVGGALVYAYRGGAGLYDVGVLESHRGRGVGRAMLLRSFEVAREMGCDCALLSAARRAVPLYQRVGFTDAGHYDSYYIGKDRLARLVL